MDTEQAGMESGMGGGEGGKGGKGGEDLSTESSAPSLWPNFEEGVGRAWISQVSPRISRLLDEHPARGRLVHS